MSVYAVALHYGLTLPDGQLRHRLHACATIANSSEEAIANCVSNAPLETGERQLGASANKLIEPWVSAYEHEFARERRESSPDKEVRIQIKPEEAA